MIYYQLYQCHFIFTKLFFREVETDTDGSSLAMVSRSKAAIRYLGSSVESQVMFIAQFADDESADTLSEVFICS